jgi:hypothetical protein
MAANPPIVGEPKNEPPFNTPVATPAPTAGLMTVKSADQLGQQATSEVNDQINTATAPLQAQSDTLTGQETAARSALANMFGSLLPAVSTGAANVKAGYDEATVNQNAIFAAAQAQLSQLKQSQAQRAQALAQEMGGPVALSEFTAGLDDQQSLLSNLGAGQMLHTLGYAQANEGEAQAFAGQVFPLIQTEQQAQSTKYFEDQKKTLQDQITQLKSGAGDKIAARKDELTASERTFALQKTQAALDKIKSQHDYAIALRTMKNDDARVAIAKGQLGVQKTGQQLQARSLTLQEKRQAQQMGLSQQEFQLRKQQLAANTKLAQAKLATQTRTGWADLVDQAYNPQVGKTIKTSQPVDVPALAAQSGKVKDAYPDKASKTGYSRLVTTYQTPVSHAITDPNNLVKYLVANNVPQDTAIRLVKARMGSAIDRNWKFGQPAHPPKQKSGPPHPPHTQPGPY